MRFRFKRGESLERGMRRIAAGHVSAATEALRSADPLDAETVHRLRQSCKRLRALLRLVRPALADDRAYVFENAAIRGLARNFAAVRDARIMLDSLDRLLGGNADVLEPSAFIAVRAGFMADLEAAEAEHRARRGAGFAHMEAELAGLKERVETWALADDPAARIAKGFKATYGKARRCWRTAERQPTIVNLHELRKSVKHHHDQLYLLRDLMAGPRKGRRRRADRLGDLLGLDHDLAVLEQRLTAADRFAASGRARDMLVLLAEERRAALQDRAFRLARRLFRAKPGKLAKGIAASGARRGVAA